MPVLKAPPKQPKNTTLQVRIDEELKTKVDKYAEFLDSSSAYVVSEALKLVFNRDVDFKGWLETQARNSEKSAAPQTSVAADDTKRPVAPIASEDNANGSGFFDDGFSGRKGVEGKRL